MKFNVTVEKKAEAAIDRKLCINCGECRDVCPTGAVHELQKTVFCMKEGDAAGCFPEAKAQSVKMACSLGCPLGIVPQTVASLVAKGEFQEAAEHIWSRNPMPGVCAAVCEHICQDLCKRAIFGDAPLNMKALERYVLGKTEAKPFKYIRKYHEKVAVIGSGPAGLSAAYHMACAGFGVTVFEKDDMPGGALRWGIPEFRLDKDLVSEEIGRIISAGIELRCGWHIGDEHSLDELWGEGYSACIIAAGESYGVVPEIKGVDAEGVYDGVQVMRQITGTEDEGVKIGEKVVVAGGGGFAADLARVLRRIGKDVIFVAEETEEELQITEDLKRALLEEGAELKYETSIGQIIAENGRVKAVELVKIGHVEDDRGRRKSHAIKGSGSNLFCETVIFAGAQKSIIGDICNAETYPNGKVKIDDRYKTNKNRIFACGDVTGETSSVVEAVASGKSAAEEVYRELAGAVDISRKHEVFSAPDKYAIGLENIRRPAAQYEEKIVITVPDDEDPFAGEFGGFEDKWMQKEHGAVSGQRNKYTEDIAAVIRSAGIEVEMPEFDIDKDAKKVAVIGGGIGGVTAAISLAKKGYKPVIFERMPALGGSCRWLATERRLDKAFLIEELKKVEASGIEVVYGAAAGIRPNIDQLFGMGFEAVLFAVGEYGGMKHDISGAECTGVFDMVSLMGRICDHELPEAVGNKVLVAGKDEMTFDVAVKLKDTCSDVTILTPWSKGVLQAKTGAVDAALACGVNLVTGVEVTSIEHKNGSVYNAVCKVVEKGYVINVPCDTLVLGDGGPETQTIAIRNLKLDMEENGHISVDHKLASSIPGVFSIGNLEMSAADAGRMGAEAIDGFLSGEEVFINISSTDNKLKPVDHEMIEGAKPVSLKGFEEGYKPLSDNRALSEAERCMECGYHNLHQYMCMGCGICAAACPVNAVTMVSIREDRGDGKEVKPWQ